MKQFFAALLVLLTVLAGTGSAYANACSSRARAELSSYPGATLLSVTAEKRANGQTVCKIRIKLRPQGGKPGRVVMRSFRL